MKTGNPLYVMDPRSKGIIPRTPPEVKKYIQKNYQKMTHEKLAGKLNKLFPRPATSTPWKAKQVAGLCARCKLFKDPSTITRAQPLKLPHEGRAYIRKNWKTQNDKELSVNLKKLIQERYAGKPVAKLRLSASSVNSIRSRMGCTKKNKPRVSVSPEMRSYLTGSMAKCGPKEQAIECNKRFPRGEGNGLWTASLIVSACIRLKLKKRTPKQIARTIKRTYKLGISKRRTNYEQKCEIGYIRTDYHKRPDGTRHPIKWIKTKDGFVLYKNWLWEQYNGPVPDKMVLMPKDGNHENVVIENLELQKRDWGKQAVLKLTDSYVAGLIAKGDKEIANALMLYGKDIIAEEREALQLKRKILEKTGKRIRVRTKPYKI